MTMRKTWILPAAMALSLLRPAMPQASASATEGGALPGLAYSAPSSNPNLPAEMNTFTPPLGAPDTSAAAPIIASSNTTVQPDQSIALTGAQLSSASGNTEFSDTRFIIFGQTNPTNATLTDAQIQMHTSTAAMITVDASEPANSMYLLWAANAQGTSLPMALNQTEAWWMGAPDQTLQIDHQSLNVSAAVGRTMSVYGKNLCNGAATPRSWVYLQSTTGGPSLWANVTAANPYKIDFAVSTPGTYQVWVNNGLGGQYSWSEVQQMLPTGLAPQLLTITATAPLWSSDSASIINVKNQGAVGDGKTNDGPAILKAIAALGSGSTLYFPAGTYRVNDSNQLVLPGFGHTRIMGDGIGKSVLIFNAPVATSGFGQFAIGWGDHAPVNVQVNSITFKYAGPKAVGQVLRTAFGSNILLENVEVIGNSLESVLLNGSNGVTVENCSFQGSDLGVLGTSQIFIDKTKFFLAGGAISALSSWGACDTSITNCTIQNFDDTITNSWAGAGRSRFIEYNLDWGAIFNQYVAGNNTSLGQPFPDNSGEQILCEGTDQVLYHGPPTSVLASSITVPAHNFHTYTYRIGTRVIVTGGTGIGQMRNLIFASPNLDPTGAIASITIQLDRPWNVPPDSRSILYVGGIMSQAAFYQNTLQDALIPPGWAHNAHAAAGIDISGYDIAIDGNIIRNVGAGISLPTDPDYSTPIYYFDIFNNRLQGCISAAGMGAEDEKFTNEPNFIGVVLRHNTIDTSQVGVDLQWQKFGSDTFTLVEKNTISASRGVSVFKDPLTLLRKNTFTAPPMGPDDNYFPQAIVYGVVASPSVQLRQNIYQGYPSSNRYFSLSPEVGLPAPILAAPSNIIPATVQSGDTTPVNIPLWNNGPVPLDWTGSTDAPWLTLHPTTDTIPDENSIAFAKLTASAASLTPGNYSAHVILTYRIADQHVTKSFIINLKVN
jgi:hypothetical protein